MELCSETVISFLGTIKLWRMKVFSRNKTSDRKYRLHTQICRRVGSFKTSHLCIKCVEYISFHTYNICMNVLRIMTCLWMTIVIYNFFSDYCNYNRCFVHKSLTKNKLQAFSKYMLLSNSRE